MSEQEKKNTRTLPHRKPIFVLAFLAVVALAVLASRWQSAAVTWQAQGNSAVPGAASAGLDANSFTKYMAVPGVGAHGETDALNALEQFWNDRMTYPTGKFDASWVQKAAAQDSKILRSVPGGKQTYQPQTSKAPLALSTSAFTSLGPSPLRMTGCHLCYDYGQTEGRINSIAIDPISPTIAYAASDGGGVWRSTNCCTTATSWSPVTDDPLLATISIDDISIDPNNHRVVYAGTGDLNFGSFSMGSAGILKSTDSGDHWVTLGADVFGPALPQPAGKYPQYNAVGKVRVDPRNSNNVVAGTKVGLYFSYNGGVNWTGPCLPDSFSSQRQDITALNLINNGSSTTIIAAIGARGFASAVQYNLDQNGANGIYKGTIPASGCPSNFALISTATNGWPAASGSGAKYVSPGVGNQLGRIDMAVAPSNSNVMYAQVQAIAPQNDDGCGGAAGCQLGLWRTTNGGTTWSLITGSTGPDLTDCNFSSGDYNQNWYDQAVAVDPNNADRVFMSTFDVWFWQAGATSFNDTTCGYSYTALAVAPVHVDQHAIAFVPGSSSTMLIGNDGGVHMTSNANLASVLTDPTWSNLDAGLNTIEFYAGDISANFANSTVQYANGGAQDNGASSVMYTNDNVGPTTWQMGVGGDGFFARIEPINNYFWQGNNSGTLNQCVAGCTLPGAVWIDQTGGWTGDTQAFMLPYEIYKGTPNNPATDCQATGCGHMIVGTTRVWETINGQNPATLSWYVNSPANLTKQTLGNRSYIDQLAYATSISTTAIVGTNDGNVQYGFGLGSGSNTATWVNVTGGNSVLPNRPILDVVTDPNIATKAYASVGGFNANTPSTPGHLFQVVCSANCASFTWTNKTGNLPDIPADSVIVNPNYPAQVFVGTDFGLYFTNDITAATPVWQRFQNGLPNVMIWDMSIDRGATTLSVWTRSRGAYVWPLPSAPFNPGATNTATPVATGTATSVATNTATRTATNTPTRTQTSVATNTATRTAVGTATNTGTATRTATRTQTAVATNTPNGTVTSTATRTQTSVATNTATRTQTNQATSTATKTQTGVATNTPTRTQTSQATSTSIMTPVASSTASKTATATGTAIGASTNTPTRTATAQASATPCVIHFSDVSATDYFHDPAQYLYCRGVISGYSDNTFRPYNNTTRGQLAKIVVLAESFPLISPSTASFTDVPVGSPFFSYIETAVARGIISGYDTANGQREYRPGNDVTRGQLTKIIVNAEGWQLVNPATATFRDVSASNPFYQVIETAVSHGIISGYDVSGGKEFRPGASATRGQIAKIVYLAVTQ